MEGGVRGHRNVGLMTSHVPHSTMLGWAVLKNVSFWFGLPGDGVLLCRNVGGVGEIARSKIESGEAGSKGEASLKSFIVSRGSGGDRKGLQSDCGDFGEFAASGEYGKCVRRGDVGENGEMLEYDDFGGRRSRGLKGDIGVMACSDGVVVSSA